MRNYTEIRVIRDALRLFCNKHHLHNDLRTLTLSDIKTALYFTERYVIL